MTWVKAVKAIEDVFVKFADAWRVAWWALPLLPEALHSAHEHHLNGNDGKQWQRVVNHGPWHSKVVEGAAIQHLCTGFKPGSSLDVCTIGLQDGTLRWYRAGQCGIYIRSSSKYLKALR